MQLAAESRQLVVQCPQCLAALCAGQHVLCSPLGHSIVQQRKHRHQFGCRLYIQVVHAHSGYYTLRIVTHGLAKFSQCKKNPHAVVVQMGTGFQRRCIAVYSLQIAVVLFLPLVDAVELSRYRIL